jgi:hypothetical protein
VHAPSQCLGRAIRPIDGAPAQAPSWEERQQGPSPRSQDRPRCTADRPFQEKPEENPRGLFGSKHARCERRWDRESARRYQRTGTTPAEVHSARSRLSPPNLLRPARMVWWGSRPFGCSIDAVDAVVGRGLHLHLTEADIIESMGMSDPRGLCLCSLRDKCGMRRRRITQGAVLGNGRRWGSERVEHETGQTRFCTSCTL